MSIAPPPEYIKRLIQQMRIYRILTSFTLVLSAFMLSAQDTANADEEIEEVVVVGTTIKGTPIDSPHAVTSYGREELEDRGQPLMVDLMKQLGASNGAIGERSGWYNSNLPAAILETVSNVNLRGLGASRTLVLINGKRQTYLPSRLLGGRFVDIGVIPSIAIGRVEILKEGASAVYGSDAVAGIANFVTRDDFEGLEVSASLDSFDSAEDTTFSLIWGTDLGEHHLVASIEHEERGELASFERDWSLRPLVDPWRAAWSSIGNPGTFWFPTGVDSASTPRADMISTLKTVQWSGMVDPACNELNGYPEHPAVDPYYCIFNYQPWDNLIEETRHTRTFAELNGPLSDNVDFHLEAMWSNAEMPAWRTQPSHPPFPLIHLGVMEIGPDHPNRVVFCQNTSFSASFQEQCAKGENWYFRGRPFGNGYEPRRAQRESGTWRLAASIEGDFTHTEQDTSYNLALSYSGTDGNVSIPAVLTERLFLAFRGYGGPDCGVGVVPDPSVGPGMRVEPNNIGAGTGGCMYFNPFSSALQHSSFPGAPYFDSPNPHFDSNQRNSPELIRWMNSVSDIYNEAKMLVFDAGISGSRFDDKVGFSTGYQYRNFSTSGQPNDHGNLELNPCAVIGDTTCLSGNFGVFTFINAYNPYDTKQEVHRVFAEVAVDINENLDAQFAANYERYEQSSSIDPKVAIRLHLNDTVSFRGSVQTTFRTPSVDDVLEGIPLTVTQLISQVGAWIPVDIYGDPNLKPEQAITYNLGLIVTPTTGFEITADYWSYDFENVIGSLSHDAVDDLYADEATRSGVMQFIYCADGRADMVANPCDASSITRVEVPLVNYDGVKTSGVDIEARNSFDAGQGTLDVGARGTYTMSYDIRSHFANGTEILGEVDAAGKLNFGNPLAVPIPNFKLQLYSIYRWDDYSLAGFLNYISAYDDDGAHDGYGGVPVDSFEVESNATIDVNLRRAFPDLGLDLSLSVLNITDQDPPFANVEHAYDGLTHNPKGRRIKLSARYTFGQ